MKRSKDYEPSWDLNVEEGDIAEKELALILTGTIEVKHKSYLDTKLYVELECDRGPTGEYRPSGLNHPDGTADYWAWLVNDTGVFILVPSPLLRQAVDRNLGKPRDMVNGSAPGDAPTRGRLIDLDSLLGFTEAMRQRRLP